MSAVDVLLDRLDSPEKTSRGWRARCPVHDDRRPSLSIALGDGGRPLLHDFGGCRAEDVLAALGLTWSDLHHHDDDGRLHHRHQRPPVEDPVKAALADILARERRRRKRLAFAFEVYRFVDLVRALRDYGDEAQWLATELGSEHPDTWCLVKIGAWATVEALRLEMAPVESIDLIRRPA